MKTLEQAPLTQQLFEQKAEAFPLLRKHAHDPIRSMS